MGFCGLEGVGDGTGSLINDAFNSISGCGGIGRWELVGGP